MRFVSAALGPRGDLALLALRIVVGAAFVSHGFPKLQHATTWDTRMMPGTPFWLQAIAAFAEFGGGIALILGILTPLFAFLIGCNMVVAIFFVALPHGAKFVSNTGGPTFELPLIYLAAVFTLLLLGPGRASVDGALFRERGARRRR
ncbi:MAG: DoxX family protein [Candidatus Eremiobacteraeota bacterium]|nr:DoxX family protein [Candidatus Eremiobacteraeota bacterium]MBC5803086.1 DoxX family protein [Candidatus Eremiobacteraeota bacterium]MBC5823091.1 DoxX family protein [Candidatus Eremiobacteraeota bacterium]